MVYIAILSQGKKTVVDDIITTTEEGVWSATKQSIIPTVINSGKCELS